MKEDKEKKNQNILIHEGLDSRQKSFVLEMQVIQSTEHLKKLGNA